jgi:AraC-like DNA-binding protein
MPDPLSDVLSLLKPRNYLSAALDIGGDWSIRFPDQGGTIKTGAVISGSCWLAVEGVAEPVRLEPGDCFLLPRGLAFRLASELDLPSVDAATLFGDPRNYRISTHQGGGFKVVSNRFALAGRHAEILLGMLPPIVHVRHQDSQSPLRWSVERMMQELEAQEPGGSLMIEHLAHMMLLQALRQHLAEGVPGSVGWLFALADRQLGSAITAMHGDPAHPWSLQHLASLAGMSRSSFAQRFKEAVGTSPLDYLIRWRMLLAGDRLTQAGEPIATIALSVGYESESAFSTAFKRVMGCSPRQYGRGVRELAPLEA